MLFKEHDVVTFNEKKKLQDKYDAMITELIAYHKIDLKKNELETLKLKIGEYQDKLLDVQNQKNTLSGRFTELEKEIEKHPQLIVLSKAITNDALWSKIAQGKSDKIPDEIKKLKLRDEKINPVHVQVMTELATTRVELNTTKTVEDSLKELLVVKTKERDKLNDDILVGSYKIEELNREKETEFETLERKREAERKKLIEPSLLFWAISPALISAIAAHVFASSVAF